MAARRTRWDNSAFFSDSADPEIEQTVASLRTDIASLESLCKPFAEWIPDGGHPPVDDYPSVVSALSAAHEKMVATTRRLRNASMFIHCCLSVNARDSAAATWMPTLQSLGASLGSSTHPMYGFLARADSALIEQVVQHEQLSDLAFAIEQLRVMNDQLLPVEQEQLLTGMATTGLHGWGNLYKNLSGTLQCTIGNETVGLAQAANKLSDSSRQTRESAWRSINRTWTEHEQSAAAILNNINGWRIEEARKRSHNTTRHYLDKSCHGSRISRQTLDAMMQTTYEHRHIPQRALTVMANAMGIDKAGPWDLMAPAPVSGGADVPFDEAIDLIARSFSEFSKPMGAYVIEMAEKGWIDCGPSDNRATGAYCGSFADPRQARIFITYEGTLTNVITLAHELGHAWHNRVMENLPDARISYPMTLAETASIFAETLVRESLMSNATTDSQRLEILWSEAGTAAALMLNIPARVEFEKRLVDTRQTQYLTADVLREHMAASWQHWYEDSLCEYDDMFWASKLHFSMSGLGFYNYPYLFGYLFSLGIYAQRERFGEAFEPLYRDILRDTGSMTAEALVQKHLQQDISQAAFWAESIGIVEQSLQQFEKLAVA